MEQTRQSHRATRSSGACLLAAAALGASLLCQPGLGQESGSSTPLEIVEVIGVTPLRGTGVELDKFPANVQSASAEQIQEQLGLDITEFMSRNFASVFLNEAQSNPLQADVLFRGFVASPLLGLPQGLSVYQDGVRVNEPFGDTVNWALIPDSAIASVDLIPGSNPIFGRNSLGGAIAFRTKNGFTHPGLRGEISTGSHGRTEAQFEAGGTFNESEDLSYHVNAWYFDEEGWRDSSPSETGRLFSNVGWRGDRTALDLDLTYVDTDLIGNGPAPVELLAIDREAIFTRPDLTENELAMLNLRGSHTLAPTASLDWNVYYRSSDVSTFNGDDSDFEECELPENEGLVCEEMGEEEGGIRSQLGEEEEPALDQFGNPIMAGEAVEGATVNRSNTRQDSLGAAVQVTSRHALGERPNQFVFGADIAVSDVDFDASTELGMLDETRLAVPSGVFVGESFTDVESHTLNYSVFFADTLSLSSDLSVVLSGRWNRTEVELRDQLGTALTGDHDFDRFNPAAGLTYRLSPAAQLYAGYFESNRVPSPVELTCADEDAPCRLPNAFLADPPLEQVVAKTWEAGVRGRWNLIDWHAGLFQGTNEDDILFISAGPLTNQGFFDNVGETRRRGLEVSLNGRAPDERFTWFLNYTHLEAEFRENFTVSSLNHPEARDAEIPVQSGDRLPGVPEDLLKAGASFSPTPKVSVAGEALYSSSRFLRGDEANLLAPVGSYTTVNVRGEYRFNDQISLYVKVDNVLDEDYETFGLLGDAGEVLGEGFESPRFLSPGAPRAAWVGVRFGR